MKKVSWSIVGMGVFLSLQGCAWELPGESSIPARPTLGAQIERDARALTANSLVGPLAADEVSDRRKEEYNRAAPKDWPQFSSDIQLTLGLYDGFDGTCGNQWLADRGAAPAMRYRVLAKTLADDRLWVNSKSTTCTHYLAVESDALATPGPSSGDCGGRTPNYAAPDEFRSLLIRGTSSGVDDGIEHDDHVHSTSEFPFLAAPAGDPKL
jgi:hypothetical protein